MPNPNGMYWIVTFGDDAALAVKADNSWDALKAAAECYYDTHAEWPPLPVTISEPLLTDPTRPVN